jgi:hypothetical protein
MKSGWSRLLKASGRRPVGGGGRPRAEDVERLKSLGYVNFARHGPERPRRPQG